MEKRDGLGGGGKPRWRIPGQSVAGLRRSPCRQLLHHRSENCNTTTNNSKPEAFFPTSSNWFSLILSDGPGSSASPSKLSFAEAAEVAFALHLIETPRSHGSPRAPVTGPLSLSKMQILLGCLFDVCCFGRSLSYPVGSPNSV